MKLKLEPKVLRGIRESTKEKGGIYMKRFQVKQIGDISANITANTNACLLFVDINLYDFDLLNQLNDKYPDVDIVAITTSGEIGEKGITSKTISGIVFDQAFKTSAALVEDAHLAPIISRHKLSDSARVAGINLNKKNPHDIALIFPTGLNGCEERFVSTINALYNYDDPLVVGATAGDDIQFNATYVYVNGKHDSNGGAVLFIHTTHDIKVYKETIFNPTDKVLRVTKADHDNRCVYTLNGKPAATAYAEQLGVSEHELENYFMSNPLGRQAGDDIFVASPFQINPDKSINFYCQVFEGARLVMLEPKDAVKEINLTVDTINKDFRSIEGGLLFNCILRKLQFANDHTTGIIGNAMNRIPNACGLISYGEQLGRTQINQTLLIVIFGKVVY